MNIITKMREWYQDRQWADAQDTYNTLRVPFIREVLPKHGVGAELGVFQGQFSPLLLKHTEAVTLHLIDPWYFLTANWHWGGGNRSTVDALVKILRTWKQQIEEKKVLVHVGDDREILKSFSDHYFDWVYVDSSHDYSHTVDELNILKSKIKPNGVIAGDDWQPDPVHRHHGVFKAVNEFLEPNGYSIIKVENYQWAIRKK
jgi:hypothetical protein